MLDQLLAVDKTLFLWLNLLGSSLYDPFWLLMSEKATNIVMYLSLVIVYGNKKGWKQAFYLLIIATILVGLTDQLTNLFKDGFMRLRPCYTPDIKEVMRLVKAGCGGQYGFFSGHASNSFALALLFSLVFQRQKKMMPALLVFASLIAYSRVYIGVHFPLDILCGSLVGMVNAYLAFSIVVKFFPLRLPIYTK